VSPIDNGCDLDEAEVWVLSACGAAAVATEVLVGMEADVVDDDATALLFDEDDAASLAGTRDDDIAGVGAATEFRRLRCWCSRAAVSSERRRALAILKDSRASCCAMMKELLSMVFKSADPKLAASSSTTKLRRLTTSDAGACWAATAPYICECRGIVLTVAGGDIGEEKEEKTKL